MELVIFKLLLVGFVYLFVISFFTEKRRWVLVLAKETHISNNTWFYMSIFWLLVFIFVYIKAIRYKKITVKGFLEDILAVVFVWYVSALMVISLLNTYNDSDKNSIKTEKFSVIRTNSKTKQTGGSRGSSSITYYYLDTDSPKPTLQRIVTTKILFAQLTGKSIEAKFYEGKLGDAFIVLSIPPENIDQEWLNYEEKLLQKIGSDKRVWRIFSYMLLHLIVLWFIMLLYILPYFKPIPSQTFMTLILVAGGLALYLYQVSNRPAFPVVMTILFSSLVLTFMLASRLLQLCLFRIEKVKQSLGNIAYYAILTVMTLIYFYFAYRWIEWITSQPH